MRIRLTIRRLMALILLIALMLGLGIPAIKVYRAKEYHVHTGVDVSKTPNLAGWGGIQPPFWPRYWNCLTGRAWRRQPCTFKTGFESDRCEFAYPDMTLKVGNQVAHQFDSEQGDRLKEILKEREKK